MRLPVSSWENIIKIQNRNGECTVYDMKQLLYIQGGPEGANVQCINFRQRP